MILNKIYKKLLGLRKPTKRKLYKIWVEHGRTVPPPHHVKQYIIERIQRASKYNLLIETGTYYGDMIESQISNFKKIISIELSESLYKLAIERFKNSERVTIYQGDSGSVLIDVMSAIEQPAIFWLDGHYSEGVTARGEKDCPIFEELQAILDSKKLPHILFIDDARLFIGKNDYPTIAELTEFVKTVRPLSDFTIADDMIKIYLD